VFFCFVSLTQILSSICSTFYHLLNISIEKQHEFSAYNALLMVFLLSLCVLAAYLIKKFKFYFLPESCAALLVGFNPIYLLFIINPFNQIVGLMVGLFVRLTSDKVNCVLCISMTCFIS